MQAQIEEIMAGVGANVVVYNGGSYSIAQQGPYSDREYYVIADTIVDLVRILRNKSYITKQKEARGIEHVDILLATKEMVRHKFFYILGTDETGAIVPCDYDTRLLRNCAIKLGFRAYLDSMLESDQLRAQYLLSKSAIQLIYAYALAEGRDVPRPLFTPDGAMSLVYMIDALPNQLADIVKLKFINASVDTEELQAALRSVIDTVYTAYMQQPLSIRSQFWRSVFALKQGNLNELFQNKDKRQISFLYDMIDTGITQQYTTLRTELLDILVL